MNKEIINSIEQKLNIKVAKKLQERREEIATSILENDEYKGDLAVQRLAKQSAEEFGISPEEQDQIRREDCMERLKKKYPDKDKAFYDQKIEDGECKKLDEENIPNVVIKRRIAGGMDPKTAATKKLGFKGKHPGKG